MSAHAYRDNPFLLPRRPDRTRETSTLRFSKVQIADEHTWREITGARNERGPMLRIAVYHDDRNRIGSKVFVFPQLAHFYRDALAAARDPKRWGRHVVSYRISHDLETRVWIQPSSNGPMIAVGRKTVDGEPVGRPMFLEQREFEAFEHALSWLESEEKKTAHSAKR